MKELYFHYNKRYFCDIYEITKECGVRIAIALISYII